MSNPLLHFISTSATQIPVTGPILNVVGGGLIQIESELISFSSATDTMFVGCTRGVAGSTAATHAANKAVTLMGLQIADNPQAAPFSVIEPSYGDRHSHQSISSDMTLDAGAGSSASDSPKFIATAMFNLFGDALSAISNYLAGVIGAYSVTGTKATTYPTGAVMGIVSDTVTDVDGAVTAVIDGDSGVTKANAAFKAMSNNSNSGSGFNFGLDLTSPTHDGFPALAILKAAIRLDNDVCILTGSGTPDATVGATFAGEGSIYIKTATGKLYVNGGSKTTPDWKLVTSA